MSRIIKKFDCAIGWLDHQPLFLWESAQALGHVVRWTRVSGCCRLFSYKTSRALANLEIIRPQLTTDIILHLDTSERPLRKKQQKLLTGGPWLPDRPDDPGDPLIPC